MNNQQPGKVILAGAGPGDADLITVKLQKILKKAEVIIVDRLVNPGIIRQYASRKALIIPAGKQGYSELSLSQEAISSLIIEQALKGKTVLRLKGGDIAFFSNVLDELRVLQQHGIPFEMIPGITAASGAAAYAGIPLTARGYAQAVRFLTFNPTTSYGSKKWRSLANTSDTLVFYMATKNLAELAELLLRYSPRPFTALAVIEQATTNLQQVFISTIKDCVRDFAEKNFSSPSLIIVGDVVELYQEFNWFTPHAGGSVFYDLTLNNPEL